MSTMTRSRASIVSSTAVREPYRFTRTPVAFSTPMISMLPPPLSWMVQLFGMCRSRAARISRL